MSCNLRCSLSGEGVKDSLDKIESRRDERENDRDLDRDGILSHLSFWEVSVLLSLFLCHEGHGDLEHDGVLSRSFLEVSLFFLPFLCSEGDRDLE